MVVSRWRQQVSLTCRYLSAKQQGNTSHNTVLSLKFVNLYVKNQHLVGKIKKYNVAGAQLLSSEDN
jgi:hypothetical protein